MRNAAKAAPSPALVLTLGLMLLSAAIGIFAAVQAAPRPAYAPADFGGLELETYGIPASALVGVSEPADAPAVLHEI